MFYCRFETPLGGMTALSDGEALTGLYFDGQRHVPPVAGTEAPALPVFQKTGDWLARYFAGEGPKDAPPLRPAGTPFQTRVWEKLLSVPYGETVSYGVLAAALTAPDGTKPSARAVGGAVGRNPIVLLIPCHRVVGADGGLTGYAAGLQRKEYLLALERRGSSAK